MSPYSQADSDAGARAGHPENPFLRGGFPEIAISGKIAIFDFPDFFVKTIWKNPENRFFGLPGPK